jgi:predicted PurR-regulated permease PerM
MSDSTILMLLLIIPVVITMGLVISKIVQTFVGGGNPVNNRNLQAMETKVQELQERIENLETIITSIDSDLLNGVMKMHAGNNPKNAQQQAQHLAESANGKADIPLDENFKMILNKILLKVDSFLDDKKK